MKNNSSSDDLESTTLGWKFIAIVAVITSIFFTFQQDAPANTSQPVEKTSSE